MENIVAFTSSKGYQIPPTASIQMVDGNGIVYYNILTDNQTLIQPEKNGQQECAEGEQQLAHGCVVEQQDEKIHNEVNNWGNEIFNVDATTQSSDKNINVLAADDPTQLHVCPKCNASFATSGYLKTHRKRKCVRSKNIGNPLQCQYCSSSFKLKFQLKRHMMVHTGERPFKCDNCPKTFLTKSHLKRHAVIHLPEDQHQHKCEQCDKVFAWASSLESHMKSHTGEKRFKCGICGRMFLHLNSLRSHMTNRHTVNGKYICIVCKQCFDEATELIVHMKTHSDQESVKCQRCFALFTSLKDLETHICTNFGGKPLICVACNCECRDVNEYCNHGCMQTNANRKCGCCSKMHKCLWHLREHLITHTGEKPFKCVQCNKEFRRKRELDIHTSRHNTEKPFVCEECLKTFTSENYLKQHQRNEHREKKFVCDVCGHAFMHKSSLENHASFHLRTGNTKYGKKHHRGDSLLVKELVEERLSREQNLTHSNDDKKELECNETVNEIKEDQVTNMIAVDEKSGTEIQIVDIVPPTNESQDAQPSVEQVTKSNLNTTTTSTTNCHLSKSISTSFLTSVIEPKIALRNAEQDPSNINTIYETNSDGNITIRCGSCFLEFQSHGDLLRHRKESHNDGKPYQCDFCSRTFSVAANLSQHRSIHNIVRRKYSCSKCGKSYKVIHKLRKHLYVKHLENTEHLTDLELQLRFNQIPSTSCDSVLNDDQLDVELDSISQQQQGIAMETVYEFSTVNPSANNDTSHHQLEVLQSGFNVDDLHSVQPLVAEDMMNVQKNVLSNIVFVSATGASSEGIASEELSKRGDVAFLMNLSSLINELGDNLGNQRIIVHEGTVQDAHNIAGQ